MEKLLKGNEIAEKIKKELKQKIAQSKIKPGLAIILVGQNKSSNVYVKIKKQACEEIGINFKLYFFKNIQKNLELEKKILLLIKILNSDSNVHGILVQLPLPCGLNTTKIIKAIDPKKDVDGFHPQNIKKILSEEKTIMPPVFNAIIKFLKIIPARILKQKNNALIIGKNKLFAKLLKHLLEKLELNVNIFFYTKNKSQKLKKISQKADILIVIVGKSKFITAEMIKTNSIIIDVGYNFIKNKSTGDVDFENIFKKAAFITPVPGGIGPLTVAFLLKNCYEATITSVNHKLKFLKN
ncbi:MAG: bifunctional 5,10-methylenetetrahydrofolate dehydrogenase/5,10-methenyltetrahydrofolate cyclohydrolase [Patescibacteria group bacterium]